MLTARGFEIGDDDVANAEMRVVGDFGFYSTEIANELMHFKRTSRSRRRERFNARARHVDWFHEREKGTRGIILLRLRSGC